MIMTRPNGLDLARVNGFFMTLGFGFARAHDHDVEAAALLKHRRRDRWAHQFRPKGPLRLADNDDLYITLTRETQHFASNIFPGDGYCFAAEALRKMQGLNNVAFCTFRQRSMAMRFDIERDPF